MKRSTGLFPTLLTIGLVVLMVRCAVGAVGCTLNDPDRDIRRIFPESTGYRTEFLTIEEHGGQKLAHSIEARLGDKLDPVFEALDVPYAYYIVLKGKEIVGRVHGVNQKGRYGGMQLIVATDPEGVIVDFYYQKISSPDARRFRDKAFTSLFKGLSLADFYANKKLSEEDQAKSRLGRIKDPSVKSAGDFRATLRGIMKNLLLLDEFKLKRKYTRQTGEKNDETTD